jgi:hypothetical protein
LTITGTDAAITGRYYRFYLSGDSPIGDNEGCQLSAAGEYSGTADPLPGAYTQIELDNYPTSGDCLTGQNQNIIALEGTGSTTIFTVTAAAPETATSSLVLVIDPGIMTGSVAKAIQMGTDNQPVLIYIFGIPLFLILVSVIMGWIKSVKTKNARRVPEYTDEVITNKRGIVGGVRRRRKDARIS